MTFTCTITGEWRKLTPARRRASLFLLLCCLSADAQVSAKAGTKDSLEQEFATAAAAYRAGHFQDASSRLEKLSAQAPKNFQVHELLGLTYAAEQRAGDAVAQLQTAVTLDPRSAMARNNLATGLAHAGRISEAQAQYREAIRLDNNSYDANRHLAGLYLQAGKTAEALPLLQRAATLRPDAYDNTYDLALASLLTGRVDEARLLADGLLQKNPSAEAHNLAGRIAEKQGRYLDAVHEFEGAAHEDPSEDNMFVWASELLMHRTYVPAIEVFRAANQRFPQSPRLLIGLGMALYAHGDSEESVQSLLRAADLSPTDARCYLYLSRAFLSAPDQADAVIERFRKYAELEPKNGLAQYYYAMSLWKGKRVESTGTDYATIQPLLEKAVALNDSLAEAHLQLGILYTDQREFEKALPQYQRALQLDPQSPDAHFRMGRYYLHAGLKDKAEEEFAQFKRLQEEHHAAEDKAKSEVQQFIVSSQQQSPAQP